MNKLSIFLSMFVAVAVAAFAGSELFSAGPDTKAIGDQTQGYWFTLSQTEAGSDIDDVTERYLNVASNTSVNAVSATTPPNNVFWHADPVANSATEFYLLDNNRRYLTVTLDKVSTTEGTTAYYTIGAATNQAQAATWTVATGAASTSIELAQVPATVTTAISKLPEGTPEPSNIYLMMSPVSYVAIMANDDGTSPAPRYAESIVGTLQGTWNLTTAETYYDQAVAAGAAKINSLIDVSALWNSQTAIDRANASIEQVQGQYSGLRSISSRPATVIAGVNTTLTNAYNTLYSSVSNKVITLESNDQLLATDGKALSLEGGVADLGSLWTLRYTSGGFTIQNQSNNCYIALIPKKEGTYDYLTGVSTPEVPAHFGVASQPTVFSIVPASGGIELYAGEQPFGVADNIDEVTEPAIFTVTELTAQDVADLLSSGSNSQFATEQQAAIEFLNTLNDLAQAAGWITDGSLEETPFKTAADRVAQLSATITPGANTSAMQVLDAARAQLASIATTVNTSLTPVLLQSGSRYLSAANMSVESYDNNGDPYNVEVPNATMVGLDAVARSQRLATAIWAFEYVSGGQCRLTNVEGLYLAAPHSDATTNVTVSAATTSADATLFTLGTGFSDGVSFNYATTEGDAALVITVGDESYDSFSFANPMTMPVATTATYNEETGVATPNGDAKYYQIASVGGGGVISALLPGDALTHSSSAIGSYWWIEEDENDPINANAFIIHSIYPGYYLGANLTLTDTPTTWYVNESGIVRPTNVTVNNVFNGYNSGLVICTNVSNSRGNAITAAPFTAAGAPNPALQTSRFNQSNWQLGTWMFVEADNVNEIITNYATTNLAWQARILEEGLTAMENMTPFSFNALAAAVSSVQAFRDGITNVTSTEMMIAKILEFNNIIAEAQAAYDEEILSIAPGRIVKIANQGVANIDNSNDVYLSGSGANLSFTSVFEDGPDTYWTVGANGNRGITFTNGARGTLGAPNASGTISSATGTYRLAINVWWNHYTTDAEGNLVDLHTVTPWYSIPDALKGVNPADASQAIDDVYNMSVRYGLGLENVAALGTGLAARGGQSGLLCGAPLDSEYSQWVFTTHVPSGIESIDSDSLAAEAELFNLSGVRVDRANAAPGIYLSRFTDGSVVKVIVK